MKIRKIQKKKIPNLFVWYKRFNDRFCCCIKIKQQEIVLFAEQKLKKNGREKNLTKQNENELSFMQQAWKI